MCSWRNSNSIFCISGCLRCEVVSEKQCHRATTIAHVSVKVENSSVRMFSVVSFVCMSSAAFVFRASIPYYGVDVGVRKLWRPMYDKTHLLSETIHGLRRAWRRVIRCSRLRDRLLLRPKRSECYLVEVGIEDERLPTMYDPALE